VSAALDREFSMTDSDFHQVTDLAYKYTGIVLGPQKKDMVYGRLARRLRVLNISSVTDYIALIQQKNQEEVGKFINAITTNLTSFYREAHHFDFLKETICSELVKKNADSKKIRVWSAGCSTGEETYSIAMTLSESLNLRSWDCKILATDLDSQVLDKASHGVYGIERIESIGKEKKKRWFLSDTNHTDIVKVKPSLQKLVSFKRLNLLESWPMKGKFDVIFCRNVLIYFNAETQNKLFERYAQALNKGGYLIIGHSESISLSCSYFESVGQTIYRKAS